MRRMSLVNSKIIVTTTIFLLLLLSLGACSPDSAEVTNTSTAKATISVISNLTPATTYNLPVTPSIDSKTPEVVTPVTTTTLLPQVETPLQVPPASCRNNSIPETLIATGLYAHLTWGPNPTPEPLQTFTGALGAFPVWATGFSNPSRPDAVLQVLVFRSANGVDAMKPALYGWISNLHWLFDESFAEPVTLTGGNVQNNIPLWFDAGSPTTTVILDPNKHQGKSYKDWKEFLNYFFIPEAGCYYLEAKWSGGSWRKTFAAGRYDE